LIVRESTHREDTTKHDAPPGLVTARSNVAAIRARSIQAVTRPLLPPDVIGMPTNDIGTA